MNCRDLKFFARGLELKNAKSLDDYDLHGSPEDPCVIDYYVKSRVSQDVVGVELDESVPIAPGFREVVQRVQQAVHAGIVPRLADDGTGGTYRLYDSLRRVLCMFKPQDEEAFAPNNPRQFVSAAESEGFRPGTYSTTGAAREVAAYLVDHRSFACVPRTAQARVKHSALCNPRTEEGQPEIMWKAGSLQEFVDAKDTADNFASSVFAVRDVQRIGILDIRLVNMDRNDGNLLVRRRRGVAAEVQLVPIDHGLSLPDRLEVGEEEIVWMGWPQAREPFGPEELAYIASLDAVSDDKLLRKALGIKQDSLRLMWVTTTLLQHGAKAGLTLYDIGKLMYRSGDEPSALERLCELSVRFAVVKHSGQFPKRSASPSEVSRRFVGLNLETQTLTRKTVGKENSPQTVKGNAHKVGKEIHHGSITSSPVSSGSETPWPSPASCPSDDTGEVSDFELTPLDGEDQRPKQSGSAHIGGSSYVCPRRSLELNTTPQAKGLFAATDPQYGGPITWTAALEKAFRAHVEARIRELVNK